MKTLAVAAVFLLAGCGGGLDGGATTSVTDSVHLQMAIEDECAPDGGACDPARVRALERASICALSSTLFVHRQAVPDAGIACRPAQ